MFVSCIYGELKTHEIWKCECKEGIFYIDALQDYKVVHWNYPEINPTHELLQKAKTIIVRKKKHNRKKKYR